MDEDDEHESNSEGENLCQNDNSEFEKNAEISSELKGNNSNTSHLENQVWKFQGYSDSYIEDLDEILKSLRW